MANYNGLSHWQTPISDEEYKKNFDDIFKKSKKEDQPESKKSESKTDD